MNTAPSRARSLQRVFFVLILSGLFASAQSPTAGEPTKAAQKDLDAALAKRADLASQMKVLNSQVADLTAAYTSWKKQKADYDRDVDDFTLKTSVLKGKMEQHNAHPCTEKCANGQCDGTCRWYNDESDQLNQQRDDLHRERGVLEKAPSLLDQDRTKLRQDLDDMTQKLKHWSEDNDANEAQITKLQATLKTLREPTAKAKP